MHAHSNSVSVGLKPFQKTFTFDRVFGPDAAQQEIYDGCVLQLAEQLLQGYNATVLAYGRTGSGKTFTMGTSGNDSSGSSQMDVGLLPRVVHRLYQGMQELQQQAAQCVCDITCTFLEIYNDELRDLLAAQSTGSKIGIREAGDGTIYVEGACHAPAADAESMMAAFLQGSANRSVGATALNLQSSRSHAIFTIFLQRTMLEPVSERKQVLASKFHLVDLAGSERNKQTHAMGTRLKEAININQGLLALGNVISSLADAHQRPGGHIPYRDSKLTRLLQDSIGGNAHTCMIACITPDPTSTDETLNTLQYAMR
eukprot:jgi/Astpho2/9248/e_gw1.00138.15.1_t